jgi:predicted ATPase
MTCTTDKRSVRIVITGAPASGKTSFCERLARDKRFEGFIFFSELARQLLIENPDYRRDTTAFHHEIYRRQSLREKQAGEKPFISDRGTADAFAFCPDALRIVGSSLEREHRRYSAVIQLGTAARLGESFFQRDEIRNESIDQALQIEENIAAVWRNHAGYHFVQAVEDLNAKFAVFYGLITELASV